MPRRFMPESTAWFELASAALLAVWSIVLSLPGETLLTTPSYEAMAVFAPEWAWALLAGALASVGLFALKSRGDWPRAIALLGGVFFWVTVGVCIVISNPLATGGWVYLMMANLCTFAYAWRG